MRIRNVEDPKLIGGHKIICLCLACYSALYQLIRAKNENLVKSLEIVMPDPVSGTGQARSGIQNVLNLLDSGFRRNDGKENFSTFYFYFVTLARSP